MRNLLGPPPRRVSKSAPAPAAVRAAGAGRALIAGSGGRSGELRGGSGSPDVTTGTGPNGLRDPRGAPGPLDPVPYNGDRGGPGDALTCSVACRAPTPLADTAGPADGVLNSTINDPGPVRARREPAYANTLGREPDVFDLGTALGQGGDQPTFRLVSQRDAAWAGALFAAVDVQ
ncbi:hypothetical protein AB0O05_19520 [Streptomyces sp. NPDC093084]|uniref:hypothetical protein n=1 Tax=Streptomyces sp. NPDC093084 TaxID=3155197 RepID=UPI00344902DD